MLIRVRNFIHNIYRISQTLRCFTHWQSLLSTYVPALQQKEWASKMMVCRNGIILALQMLCAQVIQGPPCVRNYDSVLQVQIFAMRTVGIKEISLMPLFPVPNPSFCALAHLLCQVIVPFHCGPAAQYSLFGS